MPTRSGAGECFLEPSTLFTFRTPRTPHGPSRANLNPAWRDCLLWRKLSAVTCAANCSVRSISARTNDWLTRMRKQQCGTSSVCLKTFLYSLRSPFLKTYPHWSVTLVLLRICFLTFPKYCPQWADLLRVLNFCGQVQPRA